MGDRAVWVCKDGTCRHKNTWDRHSCGKCGKKFESEPKMWLCEKCGDVNTWADSRCTGCNKTYSS